MHRDDFRSRSHRATLCRLKRDPGEQHTPASAVCAGKQACVRLLCSLHTHSKHTVHLLFFPLDSLSGVTSHFCFRNVLLCIISIKFTLCVCVCVCLSRESDGPAVVAALVCACAGAGVKSTAPSLARGFQMHSRKRVCFCKPSSAGRVTDAGVRLCR